MSGGGGNTTTTQKADPWEPLQPYIKGMLPDFARAAGDIAPYYPEQTYAGFDPLQEQAMSQQLDYANSDPLQNAIRSQFGALDYGLNSVYDPQSNPVINDYIASATRPLSQAYEEMVGNTLSGGAEGAGGFGGSRQGVAEGLAGRSYLDAVGDTSTNIYNNAYNKGLDQQTKMMALAPQTMQAGLFPSGIADQVGGRYQGQNQLGIDESMNRYNYDNNIEYSRMNDFFNTMMGQGFGSSTTTGPNPNAGNTAANMLGGGLAASQIPGMFGAYTSAAGPTMAPMLAGMGPLGWGIGGAALLGLLG